MSVNNDTEELLEGNFPISLKLTNQCQQKDASLLAKYKDGTYQTGSFCGVSNINLNLITCDHNILIPSILQSYALHWYHIYLLHPGMDRTEAMIYQNLCWLGI